VPVVVAAYYPLNQAVSLRTSPAEVKMVRGECQQLELFFTPPGEKERPLTALEQLWVNASFAQVQALNASTTRPNRLCASSSPIAATQTVTLSLLGASTNLVVRGW